MNLEQKINRFKKDTKAQQLKLLSFNQRMELQLRKENLLIALGRYTAHHSNR